MSGYSTGVGGGASVLAGTTIKTVGTGGDYATISAFIAANTTPYRCVLISDVVEGSDITVDGITVIDLDRYKLTITANSFQLSGTDELYIKGAGKGSGAIINYANPTAGNLFNSTATTAKVYIDGVLIQNQSTAGTSYVTSNSSIYIKNSKLELPNLASCGILVSIGGADGYIQDCHFVGGGTSCTGVVDVAVSTVNMFFVTDILITGSYHSTNPPFVFGQSIITDGVTVNASTGTKIRTNGHVISNVINKSSQFFNILAYGGELKMNNIHLGTGGIEITNANDFVQISNFECGTLTIISDNHLFINGRITNIVNISGLRSKFCNIDLLGGVSIASGGDDNGFFNCQFGADAGGGVNTLTINAGANRTRVVGCMSDVAIVDNGTSTSIVGSTVY